MGTWVFLGPVIPGFDDDPGDLRVVVDLAAGWRIVEAMQQWEARTKKTIEQICAEVGARCIDVERELRDTNGTKAGHL